MNIFEDLSRTISGSNIAKETHGIGFGNSNNNAKVDLSFKDVSKKIGVKRNSNELLGGTVTNNVNNNSINNISKYHEDKTNGNGKKFKR